VLDEEANLSSITALEETDVLVISSELVWQLIDESHVLARNLLRLLSFRIRAANAQLRRRQKLGEFYRQLSMIDGLTGLYNRAWLNDLLPTMIATAHGSNAPLSLIMIDLDHFKKFNDSHGHVAGDEALRAAAHVLSGALRPTDFAVRYGGEEMMVLLPDTSDKVALAVAERLCERMRQAKVLGGVRAGDTHQPLPHITASFGVATLQPQQSEHDLIATADAALYRAKEQGRNRGAGWGSGCVGFGRRGLARRHILGLVGRDEIVKALLHQVVGLVDIAGDIAIQHLQALQHVARLLEALVHAFFQRIDEVIERGAFIVARVLLFIGFVKSRGQRYNAARSAFRRIILRHGVLDGVIAEIVLERLIDAGQRGFQHHRHRIVGRIQRYRQGSLYDRGIELSFSLGSGGHGFVVLGLNRRCCAAGRDRYGSSHNIAPH